MEKNMLKTENKIFKNLYNEFGWEIDSAIKRDDWKETKNLAPAQSTRKRRP